jgi:hypothetical protein
MTNGVLYPVPKLHRRRIHPSITPHQLVAVCCVICRLFHEVPPHSCHYPLIHVYIGTTFGSLTASPPLRSIPTISDDFRRYPMHMRLNGASKTLIQLIEGVLPISHLIQCKNTVPRQQNDRYSAPEPPRPRATHDRRA